MSKDKINDKHNSNDISYNITEHANSEASSVNSESFNYIVNGSVFSESNSTHNISKSGNVISVFSERYDNPVYAPKEVESMADNNEINRLHSDVQEIRAETKENYSRLESKIDSKFDAIMSKMDSKFDSLTVDMHSLDKRIAAVENNTSKDEKNKERWISILVSIVSIIATALATAWATGLFNQPHV